MLADANATALLPSLDGDEPASEEQRATGTYDDRAALPSGLPDSDTEPCHPVPLIADSELERDDEDARQKHPSRSEKPRSRAENAAERRGGDSNPRYRCDPVRRFSKPLL